MSNRNPRAERWLNLAIMSVLVEGAHVGRPPAQVRAVIVVVIDVEVTSVSACEDAGAERCEVKYDRDKSARHSTEHSYCA